MQKGIRFVSVLFLAISILSLLLIPLFGRSRSRTGSEQDSPQSQAAGPSPSPTLCPQATPEPLWVDPAQSPTGALTQTVVIYIGNGEWAGVMLETGVYTQTGSFGAINNPAEITVDLLPGQTNNLTASGRVKEVQVGGCTYGGYTLTTQFDRDGAPLVILQMGNMVYLPIVGNQ